MITRFRVEGTNPDKHELMEQLQDAASRLMKIAPEIRTVAEEQKHERLEWECTDDVITRSSDGVYQGRMVFKLMEPDEILFQFGKSVLTATKGGESE